MSRVRVIAISEEAKKTEIAKDDCIKSTWPRKSGRLLIKKGNHDELTPDNNDAKNSATKCNLTRQLLFSILNSHYLSHSLTLSLRMMSFLLLCHLFGCIQRQNWRIPNLILFEIEIWHISLQMDRTGKESLTQASLYIPSVLCDYESGSHLLVLSAPRPRTILILVYPNLLVLSAPRPRTILILVYPNFLGFI